MDSRGLEFLLVETRNGRWTFPKGGVEPGLTQAQSAALEAFEEAGVHGRIEEMPFARYHLPGPAGKSEGASADVDPKKNRKINRRRKGSRVRASSSAESVTAHLCQVSHLEPPQEAGRNPTWFSAPKAKRRLREDRVPAFGDELAAIVDRAVSRIQRMRATDGQEPHKDALQEVSFEASDNKRLLRGVHEALVRRFLSEQRNHHGARTVEANVLTFASPELARPVASIVSDRGRKAPAR